MERPKTWSGTAFLESFRSTLYKKIYFFFLFQKILDRINLACTLWSYKKWRARSWNTLLSILKIHFAIAVVQVQWKWWFKSSKVCGMRIVGRQYNLKSLKIAFFFFCSQSCKTEDTGRMSPLVGTLSEIYCTKKLFF